MIDKGIDRGETLPGTPEGSAVAFFQRNGESTASWWTITISSTARCMSDCAIF
jgi:hypothetical protein